MARGNINVIETIGFAIVIAVSYHIIKIAYIIFINLFLVVGLYYAIKNYLKNL